MGKNKKLPPIATIALDADRPFLEQLEEAAVLSDEDSVWYVANILKEKKSRRTLGQKDLIADIYTS